MRRNFILTLLESERETWKELRVAQRLKVSIGDSPKHPESLVACRILRFPSRRTGYFYNVKQKGGLDARRIGYFLETHRSELFEKLNNDIYNLLWRRFNGERVCIALSYLRGESGAYIQESSKYMIIKIYEFLSSSEAAIFMGISLNVKTVWKHVQDESRIC
jgi:hypothetical protein